MNHQRDIQNDFEDDYISKSELKREAVAMQKLGEELINLKPTELDRIPLDEDLIDAIATAHKLKGKHEAFRRHLQYVGKMMRNRDLTYIQEELDQIRSKNNSTNRQLRQLEDWRDRLIEEGDPAINEILSIDHRFERQKLKQLIRQTLKEREKNQPPASYRELFRYLRDVLEQD